MPRKLLLFAAIAVIGSMLVLWLVTRDSSSSRSAASSSSSSDDPGYVAQTDRDRPRPELPPGQAAPPPTRDGAVRVTPPTTDDPSRPQAATVESVPRGTYADQVQEPPLEYTLPDGRKVRDFRPAKDRKPLELPPSIHAPGGRKIQPALTSLFSEQVMKAMRECGEAVPKSVLGPKPRLEGQIVIAIKQAQGAVTNAVFKLTDISSESIAETARQCVEQKVLTVKVPATGEADLDSYSINLSFVFP